MSKKETDLVECLLELRVSGENNSEQLTKMINVLKTRAKRIYKLR